MTATMFWQIVHSFASSTGRSTFASCGGFPNNVASWRKCVAWVVEMSKAIMTIAFMFDITMGVIVNLAYSYRIQVFLEDSKHQLA
jgi:hypothetical protein